MPVNAEETLGTKIFHPFPLYNDKIKTEGFFIKHRAKFTTDLASLKSMKLC